MKMMMMNKQAKLVNLMLSVMAFLTTVCQSAAEMNGMSSLSDCSFYDRETSKCLQCSVMKSNYKDFSRSFKQIVPEHKCQTHIGAHPRELLYDVNSKLFFASVYLATPNTLIQHTKKILFEVEYNCRSENECEKIEFFAVLLDGLVPIHRPRLNSFVILLPIPSLKASVLKEIKVMAHSEDACHGLFSSFSFSTDSIIAQTVSSKRSNYCPKRLEIGVDPANVSAPILEYMSGFRALSSEGEKLPATERWTNENSIANELWSSVSFKCVIVTASFVMLVTLGGFCCYSLRKKWPEGQREEIILNPRVLEEGERERVQIVPVFHDPVRPKIREEKDVNNLYDSIYGKHSSVGAVELNYRLDESEIDDFSAEQTSSVNSDQNEINSFRLVIARMAVANGVECFVNPGISIEPASNAVTGGRESLISGEGLSVYGMRNPDGLYG